MTGHFPARYNLPIRPKHHSCTRKLSLGVDYQGQIRDLRQQSASVATKLVQQYVRRKRLAQLVASIGAGETSSRIARRTDLTKALHDQPELKFITPDEAPQEG